MRCPNGQREIPDTFYFDTLAPGTIAEGAERVSGARAVSVSAIQRHGARESRMVFRQFDNSARRKMTAQTVTLNIPEAIYQSAKRAAEALKRPIEDMIVDTLIATLPLLDDVPAEMIGEIAAMVHLSDEALQGLANSAMPLERQELLHDLLDQQGRGKLDEIGQQQLAMLMAEYGRHMVRRAKAMALLMARGKPLPKLTPISDET